MDTDARHSLVELARVTGVTPRTVRYYIAQGLLPGAKDAGPGAWYDEHHLARLRLIRELQRQHLPLAEIRTQLAGLGQDEVSDLLEQQPSADEPPHGSALDYIRSVLSATPAMLAEAMPPSPEAPTAERSQWDRIALTNDIELHVRRPLSRIDNKRIERLITIARQVLGEEQP